MSDSMQGKVVFITGATNGIGKVTALELAKKGATVVIVGRDAEKTETTVQEIRAASHNDKVEYLLADLSSISEVRRLAEEFKQKYPRLDVLINNAGMYFATREETVDGYERTFALNHLAYFLLTNLLLEVLKSSAPSRIINVSSAAHRTAVLDFNDLQSKNYGMAGFRAYGLSKLANIMFTYKLARMLKGSGVTVNALHPGGVNTGFGKNNGGLMKLAMNIFGSFSLTPEQGAETSIYLASSPQVEGVSGEYFYQCKPIRSTEISYDEAAQDKLWEISKQMTGLE